MRPQNRTAGPYALLPASIGMLALAGLAIGFVGLQTLRDRLVESSGRTLALTAAESIDKLDLILAEHARSLRLLSLEPALDAADTEVRTARLRGFARDHREYRWVGIVDQHGRVVAASDTTRGDRSAGPGAWLTVARDAGLDVRILRSVGASHAAPVLAFTVALTTADGTFRGALVARMSLTHAKHVFDRSARNLRRKWGGDVPVDWHLVSPNGELIASTTRRPMLGKLALPSAFASAAAAPGHLEEIDPVRGVTMLTGYARLHGRGLAASPRWALLVHVDRSDVVAPIHTTIAKLGTLWALVTVPLLLLARWATTRLRSEWGESREESRRATRARHAADASEARMRAVLDNAAEGILTVDVDGRIASVNTAAVHMFGWTAEDLCGQSLARLLPSGGDGRHDARAGRWLARALLHGSPRTFERTGRRRDGTTFPLGVALSRVATSAQPVFVGVVRDLTERKRAESDRELLASIIEHSDDFVGLSNNDGRVVFVNPAGRRLVGMSGPAWAHEWTLDDFVFPDDRPHFHAVVVPAVLRDGRWQGELRGRQLDSGEPLTVAVNLFLVRDPRSGHRTGFAAVCRDLREQRRIEAETQQARALVLAKEMAEAASLAKSEFLATMSHEIRTPLNGVVGMTELLLDTRLTEEQREYAESLQICSTSLLGVIDDVLDFSRMEAGKLDLEVIDFDLRRTVEEAAEIFAARAHGKGIELATLVEPDTPTALRGDPNRLRQILSNLVSNALKFTERGEVVVRVVAVGDAPRHVILRFEVTDTGIGIAPERQAMIFESFSQNDAATARLYGGSGLGLAIVKRLAELMGGQIVVDSELGVGSSFTLVVRLEKQPAAVATPPLPALLGRRVLVVDDCATVRALLRVYLRALGLRSVCTEDGAQALALLRGASARGKPYEVVLLDAEMPVLDGLEVVQSIRAEPGIAAVPIVLMTAIGQRTPTRRPGRRRGVAAYLSKPIRLDRLATCMARALAPTRARTRVPCSPGTDTAKSPPSPGARILVAEDDPTSQRMIVRMLEKRGHRVDVVGDGRTAVEACLRHRYDVVFMDLRLPTPDGLAATREIRRRETPPRRTPIVALTASTSAEVRDGCRDAGMSGRLTKPVRRDELDAVVLRWLAATAPPPQEQRVLDATGLLDRIDGDLAFVRELADGLRRDGRRWLSELRAAIARGDGGAVEQTAHAIRGSVRNLGGDAASAVAERLEHDARAGDLAGSPRACATLERELTELHHALVALGAQRRVS